MPQTLQALQQRYGARYKWLVLLTVMIGTMASILSSTIVNVAIPDLSQHFQLGQERAQWVSSGFMLAMTVSMLSTPWLLLRTPPDDALRYLPQANAVQKLISPAEMGELFKVMVVGKGLHLPQKFARSDRSHRL